MPLVEGGRRGAWDIMHPVNRLISEAGIAAGARRSGVDFAVEGGWGGYQRRQRQWYKQGLLPRSPSPLSTQVQAPRNHPTGKTGVSDSCGQQAGSWPNDVHNGRLTVGLYGLLTDCAFGVGKHCVYD